MFQKYHPTRVLTLIYQPFALVTTAVLTYHEAKTNTRLRNLAGYTLFFISSLALVVVCISIIIRYFDIIFQSHQILHVTIQLDVATSGKGGIGVFIGVCIVSAAFGTADGFCQGGMVGDLSLMSPQFIQYGDTHERFSFLAALKSFMAGLAASGTLTSALRLITKAAFENSQDGLRKGASTYALVLISMYNVWDLIGRYVPLIKCLKLTSRKGLMAATLARFLFIPAFYFTSKYGAEGWMIMLTSVLGLTNGYLTVCVLTDAPKGYKGPEQNALGNLLVAFLIAGLFSGVSLDWLWLIGKGW
ncbi:hypothetical protein B296_00017571 [Ensete ventricosum]|uniref:Equilibrative nucleotide transporter 3-like n=1 Tax=Ensete ventricosum TaxID=4639 RepID=A0A427B4S1_ENSVE|nr:hypothetical protein B296_00017571 [Ensete ventricosum]